MKIQCPRCSCIVPAEKVNVATDVALCPSCDEAFRVSECVDVGDFDNDVLQNPPSGAWFRDDFQGFTVGASTRSPAAFFLVPFMCVWSGGSLGGIYGSQIVSGEFDLVMSLFGIPFVLGSILFWGFALMAICGKVVVSVDRGEGRVFVGVGRFGWTRRFDWADIRIIREQASNVHYPGGYGSAIVLEGSSRLRFGSGLSEKRRYFVLHALKWLKANAKRQP